MKPIVTPGWWPGGQPQTTRTWPWGRGQVCRAPGDAPGKTRNAQATAPGQAPRATLESGLETQAFGVGPWGGPEKRLGGQGPYRETHLRDQS